MAQFARPDADADNTGAFQDQAGGTTSLFSTIDEVTASDADFIRSAALNAGAGTRTYTARLSDVTDPVSSSGHIMRMRTATDLGGQEPVDFKCELRQGYVSEASLGTLINPTTLLERLNVTSTTFTDTAATLSAVEADAITDYTALFYRFILTWS